LTGLLHLPSHLADEWMAGLGLFADLPVRQFGLQLQNLPDQFPLLLRGEMPSGDVGGQHEARRIIPGIGLKLRLDVGRPAGPVAVAAVKDLALIGRDREQQFAVLPDVGDQGIKLRSFNQRE